MRQIIYCSKAAGSPGETHLPAILACSRNNNPELGITGVLIVIGDVYVQLLEGPKENLWALMDFIREDSRHQGMEILAERMMETREFGDWAMAHHEVALDSQNDADILAALETARREGCTGSCDRLMELVADVGRLAKRQSAAERAPAPAAARA